jgi:RNA polymerase sigma-70 factor (ECF subfamily)
MGDTTLGIEACLERLQRNDPTARDELIALSCERMRVLARKMLNDYSRLRRFEQTDDVLQNAALRLLRSLADVPPTTAADFFGLAALKIRQELLDLIRHYFGRITRGVDARRIPDKSPAHAISGHASDDSRVANIEVGDSTTGRERAEQWRELLEAVENLPEKERRIVDLLIFTGLSQADAAALLGVDVSTVKRCWRSARERLAKVLNVTSLNLE